MVQSAKTYIVMLIYKQEPLQETNTFKLIIIDKAFKPATQDLSTREFPVTTSQQTCRACNKLLKTIFS